MSFCQWKPGYYGISTHAGQSGGYRPQLHKFNESTSIDNEFDILKWGSPRSQNSVEPKFKGGGAKGQKFPKLLFF